MRNVKRVNGLLLLAVVITTGCGGKHSSLEGKVLDRDGQPLAEMRIVAWQDPPIQGYERVETTTRSDGTFTLENLYPSSKYTIEPLGKNWKACGDSYIGVTSAPDSQTLLLQEPIVIHIARSPQGTLTIPRTGQPRFERSAEGVVRDAQTGLEWYPGPYRNMDYEEAQSWVKGLDAGGGHWEMPSKNALDTLTAAAKDQMLVRGNDPALQSIIKAKRGIWTREESGDPGQAVVYSLSDGGTQNQSREVSTSSGLPFRALAVRPGR
jgi:hypothetical protein